MILQYDTRHWLEMEVDRRASDFEAGPHIIAHGLRRIFQCIQSWHALLKRRTTTFSFITLPLPNISGKISSTDFKNAGLI